MTRISKRVREEAALICAIAASNEWDTMDPIPPRQTEAGRLAWAAEKVTWSVWRQSTLWCKEAHWAEAEALIRCGWSPE